MGWHGGTLRTVHVWLRLRLQRSCVMQWIRALPETPDLLHIELLFWSLYIQKHLLLPSIFQLMESAVT